MKEEFNKFCISIGLIYEPETSVYRNKSCGVKHEWGCVFNKKYEYWVNGREFREFKEFKEYTIELIKRTKEKYKEERIKEMERIFKV